jgi:hypothetical protein
MIQFSVADGVRFEQFIAGRMPEGEQSGRQSLQIPDRGASLNV